MCKEPYTWRSREAQAMAQTTTLFEQVLRLIPKSLIDKAVAQYDGDHRVRNYWSANHLRVLLLGHLAGVSGLRHLVGLCSHVPHVFERLGFRAPVRSTLADACRTRSHEIARTLFGCVAEACTREAVRAPRRLKPLVHLLDSTSLELCLDLFPWAAVSADRAAIKLHTAITQQTAVPCVTFISEGQVHDLKVAKQMWFSPGTILVMDRAYCDGSFFAHLADMNIVFVTRMKRGVGYRVTQRRKRTGRGVIADQQIAFTGRGSLAYGPQRPLRRISYRDPDTGKRLVYLTNELHLAATTIARLYKQRWEVETFFKWIKTHLRVTRFWGRSPNALLTQLWIALLAYALATWINLRLRSTWTRLQVWRWIQDTLLIPTRTSLLAQSTETS
jgi:hypothetical protein